MHTVPFAFGVYLRQCSIWVNGFDSSLNIFLEYEETKPFYYN